MHASVSSYERPQVKSTLRIGEQLWLGAETGLYALRGDRLDALPRWSGRPVQCLAAGQGRHWLLVEDGQGQSLYRCDADWAVLAQHAVIDGEKIKCLCTEADTLLAGTKSGVFRRMEDGGWQRLWGDASGWGEVLWLRADAPGRITASVKKLGALARPALLESHDGGARWAVTQGADYQDIVLAADAHWIVSRWRGARRRGERGETKKHPLSAARLGDGGWAVLDGDKLETWCAGQAARSCRHPILAEAEHLHLLPGTALVAGVQGAFLLDLARGGVSDLFAQSALPRGLGKIKRVFALDDGALLCTATYGSFRSEDGGAHWEPVAAEWTVLDAEHLARGPDGRWWLGCQRAVFSSADNGRSWRYLKLKVKQHHYAELRGGLAVLGDRLYVGTKAGLLEGRLDDPESMRYLPAFGQQAIEALHADQATRCLTVGTADGQVWRLAVDDSPAPPVRRVAALPVHESHIVGTAARAWLATGDRLFDLCGDAATEITPAAVRGELGLLQSPEGLVLLWDTEQAWWGRIGAPLRPLPDWPRGVRHACFSADGRSLLTTDRKHLARCALPAQAN